jgi:hypothetical protein
MMFELPHQNIMSKNIKLSGQPILCRLFSFIPDHTLPIRIAHIPQQQRLTTNFILKEHPKDKLGRKTDEVVAQLLHDIRNKKKLD